VDTVFSEAEVVIFFVLVAIFDVWERLRPARAIDRFAELRMDLLAFGVALLVNRLSGALWMKVCNVGMVDLVPALQSVYQWPVAVKMVLALFAADFAVYWIHRAQHRFEFLWRTHEFHHSARQLYWFSGFRTSFLHSLCTNLPQVVIPIALFGLTPVQFGTGYALALLIQFWEHTNVNVNLGPLRWFIISPDYHRVHHSVNRYSRMNLSATFSIWDRWFGTYVDPARVPADEPLGLAEPLDPKRLPRMLLGV
jgi:alkylglycerol monooxygenase